MLTCIEPTGLQVTSIETSVQPGLFEVQRGLCMGGWVELRTLLQDIDSNNEIDDLKKIAKNGKFGRQVGKVG